MLTGDVSPQDCSRDGLLNSSSGNRKSEPHQIIQQCPNIVLLVWSIVFFGSALACLLTRGKVDGSPAPMSMPRPGIPMIASTTCFISLCLPWSFFFWRSLRSAREDWSLCDYVTTAVIFIIASLCAVAELSARHASTSVFYIVATSLCGVSLPSTVLLILTKGMFSLAALANAVPLSWQLHISRAVVLLCIAAGLVSIFAHPTVRQVELEVPDISRAADGYVICMLSDLHAGPITGASDLHGIVQQTMRLGCRVIVLNGDIAEGTIDERGAEMRALLPLQDVPDGAYFVPGNHEYYNFQATGSGLADAMAWTKWWDTHGIRSLNNSHVQLPLKGTKMLTLAGIDDVLGHPNLTAALLGRGDPSLPTILMAHRPVPHVYESARRGIAVQLSGHTHAGQIWPAQVPTAIANDGYLSGLYVLNSTQLYVGDGTVSSYASRVRLLSSAEITRVVIHTRSVGELGYRPGRVGYALSWVAMSIVSLSFIVHVVSSCRLVKSPAHDDMAARE